MVLRLRWLFDADAVVEAITVDVVEVAMRFVSCTEDERGGGGGGSS